MFVSSNPTISESPSEGGAFLFVLTMLSAGDARPEPAPKSVGVAVCALLVPGRDVGTRIVDEDAWLRSADGRARGAGGGILYVRGG